jgi:prevent-host-death family protein
MDVVPIHFAKTNLSRLIKEAVAGRDVVIARGKLPVVRLVPVAPVQPARVFGALAGRARVTPAFFEPLPEEELGGAE